MRVDIKITNLCNRECQMCAQWGRTGYNFGRCRQEIIGIGVALKLPLKSITRYQKTVEE
jgi:hypothetical protein